MTDPQLHHARWVPIESVVAFWDIFTTPVHSLKKRRNIFSYHNPYQKQIRAAHRLHKHYILHAHVPSATFKLFNTPIHSDRKVKNL